MLLVTLTTLFAFCGGPLLLADVLTPHIGSFWAFCVAFSPLFSMALGALSSDDDPASDRFARLFRSSGLCGAVLLALTDGWAVWRLLGGQVEHNLGLHWFGVLVGAFACLGYVRLWSVGWARAMASFGEHAGDVGALVASMAFTVAGLWIYPRNPEVGLVTVLFFGPGSAVLSWALWSKWAPQHVVPTHALPRARQQRRALLSGMLMFGIMATLAWVSPSYPIVFRGLCALVSLTGLGISIGAALGALPREAPPPDND